MIYMHQNREFQSSMRSTIFAFPNHEPLAVRVKNLRWFPGPKQNAEFSPTVTTWLADSKLLPGAWGGKETAVPKRSRCLRKWPSNMWWRNVFLLKVESTQIQRLDDVDSQLDAAPLDRSEQISVQRSVTIIHKIYGHHTSTIMIWDDFRHKYS